MGDCNSTDVEYEETGFDFGDEFVQEDVANHVD